MCLLKEKIHVLNLYIDKIIKTIMHLRHIFHMTFWKICFSTKINEKKGPRNRYLGKVPYSYMTNIYNKAHNNISVFENI